MENLKPGDLIQRRGPWLNERELFLVLKAYVKCGCEFVELYDIQNKKKWDGSYLVKSLSTLFWKEVD